MVRGQRVGEWVEITLSRERHQRNHGSDSYTLLELVALKRFEHGQTPGYQAYASALEDAARIAARGELGYTVRTATDGPSVQVSLVARLLTEGGEVRTDVSHEHRFEDPDSQATLVQANEKVAELRGLAEKLNENWSSVHRSRVAEIQAEYERADEAERTASELQQLLESEAA